MREHAAHRRGRSARSDGQRGLLCDLDRTLHVGMEAADVIVHAGSVERLGVTLPFHEDGGPRLRRRIR